MKIPLAAIVLLFVMSCSEDSADPIRPEEDRAVILGAAKCGGTPQMPWLRDMIRRAETEFNYKGNIYAIEYSGGIAFLHQPWVSSCLGCLTYDCEGNKLVLSGSVMNEIINGSTDDNVIYSSF